MNILVICSHGDDAVLGMGGTIHKFAEKDYNKIYVLILSELGYGSRRKRTVALSAQNGEWEKEVEKAHQILGVKDTFFWGGFPDNEFDKVSLLSIVKIIEKVKNNIKPEIVFTHKANCLNIDHKMSYEATIVATRPIPNECVKAVYTYEVLSSSEWNFGADDIPNTYQELSEENLDKKIEAMKIFESELREFPHPRSLSGIQLLAHKRGMESGIYYAEAFKLIRSLKCVNSK